ncbi:MAG: hypothetical protein V8R91_12460 [Butyricimonas faecihominis]
MQLYTEIIQNNNSFILLNSKISEINEKLAMAKYYTSDAVSKVTIDSLQQELDKNETALTEAVHKIGYLKYSKEGISNENMIEEWLKQVLAYKKAQEAELIVLNKRKIHMAQKNTFILPQSVRP